MLFTRDTLNSVTDHINKIEKITNLTDAENKLDEIQYSFIILKKALIQTRNRRKLPYLIKAYTEHISMILKY